MWMSEIILVISIFINMILFVLYTTNKAEEYIYIKNKRKQCLEYKKNRDLYFDELSKLQIKYDHLKYAYEELLKELSE